MRVWGDTYLMEGVGPKELLEDAADPAKQQRKAGDILSTGQQECG